MDDDWKLDRVVLRKAVLTTAIVVVDAEMNLGKNTLREGTLELARAVKSKPPSDVFDDLVLAVGLIFKSAIVDTEWRNSPLVDEDASGGSEVLVLMEPKSMKLVIDLSPGFREFISSMTCSTSIAVIVTDCVLTDGIS